MNLLKIIDQLQLDKIDQEEFLKPAMRRGLFKKASDYSLKAALTSIPFALFAMPKIASAHALDTVTDALNFALTLEYLEADFYTKGLAASGLIASTDLAIFQQISQHETAHVAFLKSVLGANAVAKPNFDFTGSKNGTVTATYPDVFTNYQTFLALAQAFEDTGVRAYKGQAGNLISNDVALTAALQIHSVEARHASEVRRLRGNKGWIVQSQNDGLPTAIYNAGNPSSTFPAESNLTQGGVNLSTLASAEITVNNITEAFDEPLDSSTVLSIAGGFIY
ncbi:MAG: ferritin-like domain-containing protein [Cytophagaceae bacterium]|nr:ferritin-like domain-containing protein [Cytophagaceae bacterium]